MVPAREIGGNDLYDKCRSRVEMARDVEVFESTGLTMTVARNDTGRALGMMRATTGDRIDLPLAFSAMRQASGGLDWALIVTPIPERGRIGWIELNG